MGGFKWEFCWTIGNGGVNSAWEVYYRQMVYIGMEGGWMEVSVGFSIMEGKIVYGKW